jgi:hypothetical protein
LVWALSIVFASLLALVAVATTARVGTEVGAAAYASDSGAAGPLAPFVDTLLRAQPTGTGPAANAVPPVSPELRGEVTRIFTTAVAARELKDADRAYLGQVVSRRSALAPADAEKRVTEVYADVLRAADNARRAAVLAALVTATALLIGLAAAWYAAQRGGHHRDQQIPARLGLGRPWSSLKPAEGGRETPPRSFRPRQPDPKLGAD